MKTTTNYTERAAAREAMKKFDDVVERITAAAADSTTAAKWQAIRAAEREAMTDTAKAIADAYAVYEKDVAAVLANLDRTSPAPLIRQLQLSRRADEVARANPATAEDITEAEERHAAAREAVEEVDKIAHRITAQAAERIAAAQEGESLRAEADEARATAADLAKVVSRTLSDRADLVQVAAAADLEEPTAAELEAAERTAEERGQDLTAEEIHANAKRRHRRNAVARYVRAQRSGNALNGMHTDTTAASAEDVAAWIASGKPTGADHKQPTKGGYITLEYREQTKSRPSGWYFVNRRYTVNQWHSIEQLNESGDISGYIRTQNALYDDLDAVERIEALTAAADLTAREREYIAVFCGKAARAAGAESRRAYHAEQGRRATEAGANAAEYAGRKAYCFERIGINTDTNRRQFFSRLCRHIAAAVAVEHTVQTPQEYAEQDRRYWERLQADSRRGTPKPSRRRYDPVAAVMKAAAEIPTAAAVVTWTHTAAILEAAAPCVTGWRERAAKSAAESAAAISMILNTHIDNTTEEAAARAEEAAARYAAKVQAEEAAKAAEAQAKAEADHRAKAEAKARKLDVLTLDTTYAIWCSWTEEQQAAHMDWLNSL